MKNTKINVCLWILYSLGGGTCSIEGAQLPQEYIVFPSKTKPLQDPGNKAFTGTQTSAWQYERDKTLWGRAAKPN